CDDLRYCYLRSSLQICVLFAPRIDTGKHHQNVGSDLVVLGEVLEAVLVGYSIGLGLEPRVSLTKFSDHRHLLLRGDETLNLPLGEPDLFHRGHTRRPLRACRKRPPGRRAADKRDELAPLHADIGLPPSRQIPPGVATNRRGPQQSVYCTFSLPQRGRLVLGVELNCSESGWGRGANLMISTPTVRQETAAVRNFEPTNVR